MLHDSADILCKGLLDPSVIERVNLIREKTKGHACKYFKTIGGGINPTFCTWVVIERIVVKVAELGCIPL